MKLLHTSDWHLGRTTHGESRAQDHDAVIAEIIDLARSARPDVIVHTGDLFDRAFPGYAEIERAGVALQELAALAPTVVVRGNHDSKTLFRILNSYVGKHSRLQFVDEPRAADAGGILYFPVPGEQVLRLAVLPFVHISEVVNAFGPPETWGSTYSAQIRGYEAALAGALVQDLDPSRDIPMFAAHLHVGGAQLGGSELALHRTEEYATDLDGLPPVSYAAFGHIHKPQALPSKSVTGRYAGSPLQLDFGEIHDRKSVVLVEVAAGRPAQVETVELHRGRRLRTFDGTLDELRTWATTITDDICRLTIHTQTSIATLAEQVRELLPQATVLPINNVVADRQVQPVLADGAAQETPDIVEEFRAFIAEYGGTKGPSADDVVQVFRTLQNGVEEERETLFEEEILLAELAQPASTKGGASCAH